MLVDLIKNGYGKDRNLNCAQTILHGANEAYELDLSEDALTLSTGFGGGMAIEGTCGALTAGVMVLGRLFPVRCEESKSRLRLLTKEFLNTYNDHMDSIDCKPLKKKHRTEELGCKNVVLEAAILLDRLTSRELQE